jgi:hypothetical protein
MGTIENEIIRLLSLEDGQTIQSQLKIVELEIKLKEILNR